MTTDHLDVFAPEPQRDSDPVADAVDEFLRRAEAAGRGDGGLYDFIPRVTRSYEPPRHLDPLVQELERAAAGQPVRLVCHAPPRHGKTETVLHAIGYGLRRNPCKVFGYATYGADLSYSKSRVARDIARRAGVELAADAAAVKEWRTREGGGMLATGVGGPFTGYGVDCLFVDDPFKNRIEAESAARRRQVIDWWNDVAFTRLEPNASAVVFATRWHPDDLSGHLIAKGWKYIRLPAIDDLQRPLWPARYDTAALLEIKRQSGEYTWASLYQGLPRPRGGSLFKDTYGSYTRPALETVLRQPKGWRKGIGIDLAYTKRTSADYSAAVLGLAATIEGQRRIYILELLRDQVDAPVFARRCADLQARNGGASALWYASTTERGTAALLGGYGFKVDAHLAVADKFIRAQPYAATWNDGRILLPADVGADSWVNTFLAEHLGFTGLDGAEDDQVDAGAALHDLFNLSSTAPAPPAVRTFDYDSGGVFG